MDSKPSNLAIRPARPEEQTVLVHYQIAMAHETEDLALDPATVTAGVRAVFEDPRKGEYFVAADDDRILGMLLTVPEWSDWRNGTVLWIESVYVLPEARGQGIFRRLYQFLAERVQTSPDLYGLRLYVDRRNQNAQKVYEALGMTREHYELYEWLK